MEGEPVLLAPAPPLLKNRFVRSRRIEPFYTGGVVAVNRCALPGHVLSRSLSLSLSPLIACVFAGRRIAWRAHVATVQRLLRWRAGRWWR